MYNTLPSVPVSDLRNNFPQIIDICEKEPIILTKNGKSILVVMDFDIFKKQQAELERLKIEIKKVEKELDAVETLYGVGLAEEKDNDDILDEFLELIKKQMMAVKND